MADPKTVYDWDTSVGPIAGTPISRGISSGILQVGEAVAGFGETLADLVGADSAKEWLKGKGDYLSELNRSIPTAVEDFTKITDTRTLGAYAAFSIGKLAPQMGLTLGVGLAARAAGGAAYAGLRTAAGAGAASYVQETGGIYRGIRDETGVEAPGTALAFGAPAAALDLLTPARFLGKVFDEAKDEAVKKIGKEAWGSLVKRSFIEAAKAAPIEGLTEGLQETIAVSASKFADNTYDAVNGRNFIRILDAGISGVIGGGLIGGATPLAQRAVKQDEKAREGTTPEAPLASMGPDTTPTTYYTAGVTGPKRGGVQYVSDDPKVAAQYAEGAEFGRPGASVGAFQSNLKVFEGAQQDQATQEAILGKSNLKWREPDGNINFYGFEENPDIATRLKASGYDAIRISEGEKGTSIAVLPHAIGSLNPQGQPLASVGPTSIVTPAQDAEYLDAVKRGDTVTAQRLVDEAAKKAGFDTTPLFHGTPFGRFNERAKSVNSAISDLKSQRAKAYAEFFAAGDLINEAKQNDRISRSPYGSEETRMAKQLYVEAEKRLDEINKRMPFQKAEEGDVFRYVQALDNGYLGQGFYFTKSEKEAQGYASHAYRARGVGDLAPFVYRAYVKVSNPYAAGKPIKSPKTDANAAARKRYVTDIDELMRLDSSLLTERLKESGYDGVVGNYGETDEVVAFDANQIKSAESVTYDDDGKPIPLSQRFNPASPDIRYSVGPAAASKPLSHTVESARAAIAPLMARFGINVEVLPVPPRDLGSELSNALGMAYADGRVQLFAGNIPADVNPNELFFHEVAVHLGLQVAARTPQEKRELSSILNSVAPRMIRLSGEIAKRGGFADSNDFATRYGFDIATPEGRQGVVAELLAREAQRYAAMKNPPSWWRQLIGKLKAFLGRIFKFDIGDDGVYAIVTKGLSRAKSAQQRAVVKDSSTTQPLASVGPITTQPQLAKAVLMAPDQQAITEEAIMASGQITGLFDVLKDHFARLAAQFIQTGVSASERVRRLERAAFVAGLKRLQGIEDYNTMLGITPQQFDAVIAALPTDGMKVDLALSWWNHFNLFERNARRVAAKMEAALAVAMSDRFQNLIRQSSKQLDKQSMAEEARKLLAAQLKNGLEQAQERSRNSGANQQEIEDALREIRYFSELLRRVDPIQRRMNDIISSANTNQALFEGIVNGTLTDPDALLAAYLAAGGTLPDGGETLVDLNVAVETLARSLELAGNMLAAEAAEDAAVQQAVVDIAGQVRASVSAGNFRLTVHNILRRVVSLATREGKAAAIFKITQRPLVRQIEQLEALEFGDAVFKAVQADPRYKAMFNRATELVGGFNVPAVALGREKGKKGEMADPLSGPYLPKRTITMPDGQKREFVMTPNKAAWTAQLPELETTLGELTAWLQANPDNTAHGFYKWQHTTLNSLWHGSAAMEPPNTIAAFNDIKFKLMDAPLKMGDATIAHVGGRAKQSAIAFAGMLKDSMHLMSDWAQRNLHGITHEMVVAVRSHPEILKGQNLTDALEDWYYDVLNPLFASLQDPSRTGYRVGDFIAETGFRVTREDMAAARRQAKGSLDAHNINVAKGREQYVTGKLIEDTWIPGLKSLRGTLTTSPMMVPRKFSRGRGSGRTGGVELASQFINEVLPTAAARENAAKNKLPTPPGDKTPAQFWRDPNRFRFIKSMVANRSAEYSTASTYEEAFREAKSELEQDPSLTSITDLDSLVSFIAQRTRSTPADIEAFIVSEMNRGANAIIAAIPELVQQRNGGPLEPMTIELWEKSNSFTMGRGKALAPPAWYEYGFQNTRDILNFSASGNSFYHEQYVQVLKEIARDMREYKNTVISKRITAIGEKSAYAENKENVRLGNELLLWENVDDYAIGIDSFANYFNEVYSVGGKEVQIQVKIADAVLNRLVGSILFNWIGTARNAHEGGFFWNGVRLSRLEGSVARAFPRAAYHLIKTSVLLGRRMVPTLLKAGAKTIGNIPAAAHTMFLNPKTRWNIIKAENKLFGESVDLVAESLFGVRELDQQLNARGIGMTSRASETAEDLGDLWNSQGVIRETSTTNNPFLKFLQPMWRYAGAMIDVQLALFAKPFFPRLGDRIANEAVASSTFGALKNLEKRLKKLAYTMRQAGVNPAGRRFTANEIFKPFMGFDRSMSDIRFVEQWFADSNIDFHNSISEWFTRLVADPNAAWLPLEDKWRLAVRGIEVVNVATGLNRPLATKKNFFTRMIGLLLGWNIHALSNAANYLGRSATDSKSQFRIRGALALWMLAVLVISAGTTEEFELLVRMIARLMGEPERATRLPWEFESTADQAKSHLVYAFNTVPFIASGVNAMFNDLPNKAAFSPYFLFQNQMVKLLNYAGGVVNTGDVTFGLVPLMRSFVPLSSVVLNQLPEVAGQKPAVDVTRLYTRLGDKESLAKPFAQSGPGGSANYTALSPYGNRLMSAVISGDTAKADALYAEAIQVATRIGKRDPEASVRSLVLNRLPIARAFKNTPTPAQYSALLAKMTPDQRERVSDFNSRATVGLARLGITTDKIQPLSTKTTTGTTRGRSARSRGYRAPQFRLNRTRRVRLGTRRRTRRNSLVRSAVV